MPILKKIIFPTTHELFIWKISESVEELLSLKIWSIDELNLLNRISSISRKKELLITRLILREALGDSITLAHHKNGEPFLLNSDIQLSISHTKGWVALAFHKSLPLGVDIQILNPKLNKIANKFIALSELKWIDNTDALHKIWCIKEAIYKRYKGKTPNFNKEIEVTSITNKHATANVILLGKKYHHHISVNKFEHCFAVCVLD